MKQYVLTGRLMAVVSLFVAILALGVPDDAHAGTKVLCESTTDCQMNGSATVSGTLTQGVSKLLASRGATATVQSNTMLVSPLSGATTSATNIIPAGAFVLGCTARVTTTITGASAFTIGDGSDVDKWGTGIALTAGTSTTGAAFTASPSSYATATSVVLTATTSNFTAGAVRVTCFYWTFAAPSN